MSKDNDGLPISVEAARQALQWFIATTSLYCKEVYIAGSRSPASRHAPRPGSDWDFFAIVSMERIKVTPFRDSGKLHGDIVLMPESRKQFLPEQAVMIWPEDKAGFWKDNNGDQSDVKNPNAVFNVQHSWKPRG